MELGDFVRKVKALKGMTNNNIIEAAGIHLMSLQNICGIGNKTKDIRISTFVKVAKAIGYNVILLPIDQKPTNGSVIVNSQQDIQEVSGNSPS